MPDKIPQTVSCTTNTDLQQRWRIGKASNEESGTRSVTYVGRPEAGLGFLHARISKNPMAHPWRGACPDRASGIGRRGCVRPEPYAIGDHGLSLLGKQQADAEVPRAYHGRSPTGCRWIKVKADQIRRSPPHRWQHHQRGRGRGGATGHGFCRINRGSLDQAKRLPDLASPGP